MRAKKLHQVVGGMEIVKQLAVFVANRPGTFASVCELIADHHINIHAMSTSDTTDHSVVRLVLDDPDKALRILENQGMLVVTNDVLLIHSDSQVGSLAVITRCLANNKINIEYAYCSASPQATKGFIVLRIQNLAKAMKVLNTCDCKI